jgi:hypothetical protein
MKNALCLPLLVMLMAACRPEPPSVPPAQLEENFIHPPADAGPDTWWHWLNGNVTREGITRDLEELKDKGYRGATAFSIGHPIFSRYAKGPVDYNSPEWHELFRHAVREAERLGLKLMFHNCDGWATSGGPWVTPENAMKQLTYSTLNIKGPVSFEGPLPEPGRTMNHYEDIAVIACPVKKHHVPYMEEHGATARSSAESRDLPFLFDDNFSSYGVLSNLDTDEEVALYLSFREPVLVSKLLLYHTRVWGEAIAIDCELLARQGNGTYQSLVRFNHHQPWSLCEFRETEAREFKLVFHSFDRWTEYIVQQIIKIREFHLLPPGREPELPLISDWENKAGYSNYRVDGHYLPQGPVDPELIIPAGTEIDLTGSFQKGTLQWEVPEGEWRIIRLGYTITGKPNEPSTAEGRGLECDKFSAASVEAFFSGMPERLLQHNKASLGKTLQGILIDSWEAANQNWTRDFAEAFRERRGYDLVPWIPVLCGGVVESVEASERFLWDFRRTMGDLIAEQYYGEMAALSHRYGVSLQAEAAHVALQYMVDAINYHSRVDIPMNEFWIYPDRIGYVIRPGFSDAPSAAHLYDKRIVTCESFTCGEGNWRHSPAWLKPAADKVFCMGVNRITFDTYTHQPDERVPGWNLAPWGTVHNRKLTWWEVEKPWIQYLTRCQYLLQMGDHVADFLVFTGEGVPSFLPVQSGSNNGLIPRGFAFDGCNRETLLQRIRVKDGKLILPHGPSYRAIVLTGAERMTPELAWAIARLVKAGATVIGPRPVGSPSLQGYPACDEEVLEAADLAWGTTSDDAVPQHRYGEGKTLHGKDIGAMIQWMDLVPDFEYKARSGHERLEYIHKRVRDMEVYFIASQDPEEAGVLCTFRVKGKKPEIWSPDKGTIDQDVPFRIRDERIEVPLLMGPYGSVFVIFRSDLDPATMASARNRPEPALPGRVILDSLRLEGPWSVAFSGGPGGPAGDRTMPLASWTEDENDSIRYFSGTAVYRISFRLPAGPPWERGTICLQLGKVREIAQVFINGREAGISWKPPYEINANRYLEPGENILEIHVVNTWTNRLIGDLDLPAGERHTWVNCCLPLNEHSALMESGLLGPVKFIVYRPS